MNLFSINIGALDVTRRVQLIPPQADTEWWYLVPENVCSDDGLLMIDNFDVEWNEPNSDGSVEYGWATNEAWLTTMLERYTFVNRTGAIEYHVRLTPRSNGIDIDFTVRNTGKTELKTVTADFCLINHAFPIHSFLNPRLFKRKFEPKWGGISFHDCDSSHTWVYTGGKLVPANSMRIQNPPKWVVKDAPVPKPLLEFYGARQAAEDPVDKPVICRSSGDGNWSIVYGWKSGFLVWQNPSLQCIHVDPGFGDIAVGEESRDYGAIRFIQATVEEACDAFCNELEL